MFKFSQPFNEINEIHLCDTNLSEIRAVGLLFAQVLVVAEDPEPAVGVLQVSLHLPHHCNGPGLIQFRMKVF